jgi:hypothetical protein
MLRWNLLRHSGAGARREHSQPQERGSKQGGKNAEAWDPRVRRKTAGGTGKAWTHFYKVTLLAALRGVKRF